MTATTATIQTLSARRYLGQMCKHFAHKVPVDYADTTGRISFPMGTCAMKAAGDVLTLTATADDAGAMPQLQDVIARHLVRFAFRETLDVRWVAAA